MGKEHSCFKTIIQLPCPELKFLWLNRPPLSKGDYDNKYYRNLCSRLSVPIAEEMTAYKKEGYKIIGLIGIEESPTCDTQKNKGIFMEELFLKIKNKNLKIHTYDIPEEYRESKELILKDEFMKYLKI